MHGNRKPSIPGFMNRQEFGAFLGISYQRVVALGKTANPPPFNADGYIASADAAAWCENYVLASVADDRLSRERMIAQTRKDNSVAEKNEIDNAAREAELVEASEVAAGWQEIRANVEARFRQVPAEGAAVIAGIPADAPDRQAAIVEALTDVIRTALADLSTVDDEPEAPRGPMPPV